MPELNPGLIIYKILKQLSTLVTTAFAFAAGYEWRIAIGKFLKENIEIADDNIFIYPIIVTIIAVVVTVAIESFSLKFLSTAYMQKAQDLESDLVKGTLYRKEIEEEE